MEYFLRYSGPGMIAGISINLAEGIGIRPSTETGDR
jgi:hypothetical protein